MCVYRVYNIYCVYSGERKQVRERYRQREKVRGLFQLFDVECVTILTTTPYTTHVHKVCFDCTHLLHFHSHD